MATIRKRTWKNKSGSHYCYEINCVIDGERIKKSGYSSKADAMSDYNNLIKKSRQSEITFINIANDYLDRHCELYCKQSTKTLYSTYLNVSLKNLHNMFIKDIKKRHIESLVLNLKQKDITNKTINGVVTFVQAVLNYAVDNSLLTENPVLKFDKLPQIKPTIHFLDENQIEVFLKLAKEKTPTYYTFFATAVLTGMRRGELLALEWSDIDFKKGRIHINKQIYKGVKQATKTNKERFVDMSDNLINILKEHKQATVLSRLVFHRNGKPLHPYNMENTYFHPLIKECNKILSDDNQIEKLRFHDLRHTYATYLLSHGISIKYVQEQLGHSTARMTLDTYAKYMPSVKNGAMDLLNKIKKEHEWSTKIENHC